MKAASFLTGLFALALVAHLGYAQADNSPHSIITVSNTANSGAGSLRQAISTANDSGQPSTIQFNLPGNGPHVIEPSTQLPALTVPTLIDGLSQNGADCNVWPPTLQVVLSGAGLSGPATSFGLRLSPGSDGSHIRGLVINGFSVDNASTGLLIASNNNHVSCNFIGTDVTGQQSVANTRGISLTSSANNVIGLMSVWTGEHERNLISGNSTQAITIIGNAADDNRISGNWIGVDVTGNAGLAGSTGIHIGAVSSGAPTERIIIGYDGLGDPLLMRNIISGHSGSGVSLGGNTRSAHIAGNYIGLNAQGNAAIPNGNGIQSSGGSSSAQHLHHLIGWDGTPGQRAAQRNVISGNNTHGISINFFNNYGNEYAVVGNWIGTDAQGDTPIANGMYGLSMSGGTAPSRVLVHGNRISNNSIAGIQLHANSPNQHPVFWNNVTHPDLPNLDSIENCLTDNVAAISRVGTASPVTVTFTNNWWGADDGPGGSGGGSGDSIPGAVNYQPFLLEPPEHCGNLSVAPSLHLSPTELDFGEVEIGSNAGPLTVTMQNLGNGTASALGIDIAGDGFSIHTGSCTSDLPPNTNCQFSVYFSPESIDPASGNVSVYAGGQAQVTLPLSATPVRLIEPDVNGILYVDQAVSAGNQSGDSWANALPDLHSALDWAANDWSQASGELEIWVAEGIYTPTDNPGDNEASFVLVDTVKLYGGFSGIETDLSQRNWADHTTVLSGAVGAGNVYNVLFAEDVGPSTRVDGFTVSGGRAVSFAGGIPALGGGIYMLNSEPIMSNMIFTDNRARAGGGAYMYTSKPVFINVLFFDNHAEGQGGGGVYNNANSHARYINCIFYANFANGLIFQTANGGGMFNWNGSSPEIINSIFWANESDEGEGQIHGPEGGWNGFTNEARIAHSIIEDGMPDNTIDNGNNLFDNPLFVDSGNGDFNLERESPAVNAGDPSTDLSLFFGGPDDPLDLAGQPRVYPGLIEIIDMGTFELQDNPPLPVLAFDPATLDFGGMELGSGPATLQAGLENHGDADATGLVFTLGGDPGFSISGGDCTSTLTVGDNCTVEISFLPAAAGPSSATLTLSGEESSVHAELTLSGSGTVATLELAPELLDFGDVAAGQTSDPASVTLSSAGSAPLQINAIDAISAPFALLSSDCTPPITLNPGDSCQLELAFSPTAIGTVAASPNIASNAPSSPDSLSLEGRGMGSLIELAPTAFTETLVAGEQRELDLMISNSGNLLLDWSISFDSSCGAGVPINWISFDTASGSTAPSDSSLFSFTIDSSTLGSGSYSAVACVTSSAFGMDPIEVPIQLDVTTPALAFNPPSLEFDDQQIHAASSPMTALLHNSGDGAASELEFQAPVGFELDASACGLSLPVGESCQISVSFAPTTVGEISGQLTVTSAQGSGATLNLTGTGIDQRPDEIFADRFE